jgi:hypothetical protein
MVIRQSINYGDAETRGKLRSWKKKLAADYAIFDATYRSGKMSSLAADLALCTKSGRVRALTEIRRNFGPGATLEKIFSNGKLALFSILKPRDSIILEVPEDTPESEHASLSQNCVTVNYILTGKMPGILIGRFNDIIDTAEGYWTLEVPDHALGRAVERSRFLHPGAIIKEAHYNLLNLANSNGPLLNGRDNPKAYIKAGPGCFIANMRLGRDISIGDRLNPHVRVTTWLHEDQLGPDQIALSKIGEPGDRLGDGVLLPRPLCEFLQVGPDEYRCLAWSGSNKGKEK